jgi:L-aspartate oxidase
VRTDLDGRTPVHGLYACGEVASTGVHGANRLAGNSLSEALVFGARAARALAAELPDRHGALGDPPLVAEVAIDVEATATHLREEMLLGAGPVRSAGGLARLAEHLEEWAADFGVPGLDVASVQLHHALRAARMLTRAASLREESRGGHRRADHPDPSPAWAGVHLELIDV